MSTGSRTALETLLWLSEDAFQGDPNHSLLANLKNLHADDWTALPAGCNRSISEILEHVGWSKWMYDDVAFKGARLQGDQPPIVPAGGAKARPREELLAWLKEGHGLWLASCRALPGDNVLGEERPTTWEETLPIRTLMRILIAHDIYHAGEINHLSAILHGTDRWPYDES
jgi:uncharacterized damage-inducible protein DinB